jgi:hypothetical protein
MKHHYQPEKELTGVLASKHLFAESKIQAEQRVVSALNRFANAIQSKTRQQLVDIKCKILDESCSNKDITVFIGFMLNIVNTQLNKTAS